MKRLKELRANKGVSQQDVADYLEITRQAYSNYENGSRQPDNETLLRLGEYFDVTVGYLLGAETEKTPTRNGERQISDDDIMFALWGDTTDIEPADLEDVKRYAAFIRERKKNK